MDQPRITLRNYSETNDRERFRLKINVRDWTLTNDGSLAVWLDHTDVSSLSVDCASALLDDDITHGKVANG